MEKEAVKQIRDEGPNIIILMIGENIFLDSGPEGLEGHIVSLTTMMCNKGYTEEVVMQITATLVKASTNYLLTWLMLIGNFQYFTGQGQHIQEGKISSQSDTCTGCCLKN